jgi:hypothetical protein
MADDPLTAQDASATFTSSWFTQEPYTPSELLFHQLNANESLECPDIRLMAGAWHALSFSQATLPRSEYSG